MKIDFSNCIKSNAAIITIGNIFLLGKCILFRGEWDDVCNSLSKENVFKGKCIMCMCVYLKDIVIDVVYLWGREEFFVPVVLCVI